MTFHSSFQKWHPDGHRASAIPIDCEQVMLKYTTILRHVRIDARKPGTVPDSQCLIPLHAGHELLAQGNLEHICNKAYHALLDSLPQSSSDGMSDCYAWWNKGQGIIAQLLDAHSRSALLRLQHSHSAPAVGKLLKLHIFHVLSSSAHEIHAPGRVPWRCSITLTCRRTFD
mmetsp:Transcript_30700/g.94983  ORF Transcript_30700/g.94983 Transcript_30700/m.94983 type:complete len:171 (+) Transcript_30700:905-1417(+)